MAHGGSAFTSRVRSAGFKSTAQAMRRITSIYKVTTWDSMGRNSYFEIVHANQASVNFT